MRFRTKLILTYSILFFVIGSIFGYGLANYWPYIKLSNTIKAGDNEIVLATSHFVRVLNEETSKKEYVGKDAQIIIIDIVKGTKEIISNNISNVEHKAAIGDIDNDGLNEIVGGGGGGGNPNYNASLIVYRLMNNKWVEKLIWMPPDVRVRDVEIGDVDNDNKNDIVAITHEKGVMGIFSFKNNEWIKRELMDKFSEITYVHEVEIGDVDNDGLNEIFTTPTDPNVELGEKQPGIISMFKWDGNKFNRFQVDHFDDAHSKEIVIGDVDNDNRLELIASIDGLNNPRTYLKIKKYEWINNELKGEIIWEFDNELKSRTMAVGDINNDGKNELLIGTSSSGLVYLYFKNNKWFKESIDKDLPNIHSVAIGDVDKDGLNDVIGASDDLSIVNMYRLKDSKWEKINLIQLPEDYWIWAIDIGNVDND